MWSLPAFVALCLLFYALPAVLHAMRERWSVVPLYVFLGFVATAMVFITDTGAYFEIGEFRFLVGSTVFFVSLLLSIFIIYTFDSVRAARIAITFALAVTVVAPLLRGYLYSEGANFGLDESAFLEPAPMRVYVASTLSMALSFILLVILWQSLRNREKRLPLAAQIFLTLFVTLQFDALVFVTGAFAETEDYGAILSGHIFNRIFIAVAASPVLAFYFSWRLSQSAVQLPRREIFAILHSSQRTEADLGEARREIELRKQVEAALRESEERYKAVFYHSPVGILHFDNAGVVQECNDRLAQIIGVGPERLCGLNMLEALRDEEMRAAVSKALDSGIGYFNNYYRTITSDRLLWLRCQFRALYNASGRQIGGVGIFDDQTEQKAVQETLLQNEERVRTLLAALPVGVMIVDAVTDQVVDANPAALDMVQMDLEALREKTIDQMVDGNTTLPRGVSQETTIRSHPSAALPVLRTVVDVELSRKAHRIEILMDNTERKKAEEALQRRDAILEAVNFSAQRFLESHNPEKQIPDVLKRLGRATAVSRVYIFKNYTDENNVIRMNQQWEWCATGVAAQIDNPDLHGLAYSEAGFDRWAEILADGQALYGDVEDFPEGERQMLEPQGIISIVVTPILVGERFYGFIGFDECSTPRKWTSVEVEALHGAGRALGLALARSDAENAVRRSEEQLDLALRGAALGTWNWHLDTNRVDFNEGWAEMLGYRLDEVESHVDTWKNALHPNDIAQTVGALRLHLEGESEKYESEHRLKTKSGDWIWVLDRGRIVERDSEGNAVRMAGTHLDITERKKMDAALTAAREKEKETESRIEETLLRGHVPRHIDGAETAALSAPSEHIDGDFYDFFQHGPHCFDILVGDVMGKGIQAALVGAGAKSHFLRALSALPRKNGSPRPASVHDIVAPVHSELAPQLLALERFITLIYARFDLDKKTLEFVDCGHMRTLHFHATDHSVSFIKGHNMPVGFVHSEEITTVTTRFGDGDLLLFYSDGVTEATDSEGNYFDEAHLQRYVEEHRHLSPNALIHALRGTVADFSGKTTFHDDFTCIAVRIGASPAKSREITIDSDLRELRGMRTFLRDLGGEIDSPYWNDEQTDLLLLSMQETLVNIIEHGLDKEAGHPIQIRAEWDTRHLTLSIIHEGRAFDPSQVLIPQIEAPLGGEISLRGRGLYIIRESTDSYTSGQINVRHACTTLVWHLHEDDINEKER